MFWNNLALNKKVTLFIGVLLSIICVMAVVFITRLTSLSKEMGLVRTADELTSIMLGREIDHLKWVNSLQRFVFDESMTALSVQEDPHNCAFGKWYYSSSRKDAEALFPAMADPLRRIEQFHTALHATAGPIKKLKAEGKIKEMEALFEKTSMANMQSVQTLLAEISTMLKAEKETSLKSFTANVDTALISTYASVLVAAVSALLLGLLIARSITAPTVAIARFANRVAEGDFAATIHMPREDELGSLAANLQRMVTNMVAMIATSEDKTKEAEEHAKKAGIAMQEAEAAKQAAEKATSEGMHQAASRLDVIVSRTSAASDSLAHSVREASSGSETQRRYASETATAMVEMTATVCEVAQNAASAADSADEAKQNAQQGAHIVSDTIAAIDEVSTKAQLMAKTMNTLGEQAQGIGQVMNVITDIADQTNLLALNAAIEAARAGEAGRGFAVVADEVRKLAEKTMTATKEVGDVIRAIQASTTENIHAVEEAALAVDRSTQLARSAGDSLSNIVRIADSTADKVRSIATASEEQSAASEEINKGTEAISKVASSNAGLMQDADSAVRELASLTRQISDLVEELQRA